MVTYTVTERPNINCSCQRHKPVPVVLAFNPGLLGCYQQFKPWSLNGSHNGACTCWNSCGVNLWLVQTIRKFTTLATFFYGGVTPADKDTMLSQNVMIWFYNYTHHIISQNNRLSWSDHKVTPCCIPKEPDHLYYDPLITKFE